MGQLAARESQLVPCIFFKWIVRSAVIINIFERGSIVKAHTLKHKCFTYYLVFSQAGVCVLNT